MPAETVQLGRRPTYAYVVVADGARAGSIFQLRPGTVVLGRSAKSDISLDDHAISGEHAHLHWEGEREIELIDLGSENGTRVNGRRTTKHRLRHNDEIQVGETRLVFKLVGDRP